MKTLISILIITFGIFISGSGSLSLFKYEKPDYGRKCTGSANCTACSNCSGCAHCAKNGGSCGVCGGKSSTRSSHSSSKKNTSKKSKSSTSSHSKKATSYQAPNVFIDETLIDENTYAIANVPITIVREKPSFKSKILEKIPKNSILVFISKKSMWYKVKIKKTGNIGYVYHKDIKILN